MCMRAAGAVQLLTGHVLRMVSSGVAARKPEERHGGHAGGSKNDAEDVEVHLHKVDEVLSVCRPTQG